MLLGTGVFSLLAGFGVSRLGYYTPFMIAGTIVLSIGAGLITTWGLSTGQAAWIGYQVILGAGAGLGIQQAHTAAQTVLADADVPTGAVVIIFAQLLGGTISISVAENVFENRLLVNLRRSLPQSDAKAILDAGATNIRSIVLPKDLPIVLQAYTQALTSTYYVATGLVSSSIVGAVLTEWKSIKNKMQAEEE